MGRMKVGGTSRLRLRLADRVGLFILRHASFDLIGQASTPMLVVKGKSTRPRTTVRSSAYTVFEQHATSS